MAGNVVTVPPAPGPPPGQALPGQVQIQWMAPPPDALLAWSINTARPAPSTPQVELFEHLLELIPRTDIKSECPRQQLFVDFIVQYCPIVVYSATHRRRNSMSAMSLNPLNHAQADLDEVSRWIL
ncbi:hypothetical protein HOLleu_00885 [Holothuria leucospilota]|uniref:Uncharacterized protein n=1 Tax=Holothuria leucospilota TaxID=206669 RepID=A0A9Q1CNB7_HOLLE|nr:hypothetical protein HOLleu_00885 [Holothuria leucospilota]